MLILPQVQNDIPFFYQRLQVGFHCQIVSWIIRFCPYDIIHSFPPHSYIRNGYQFTVYAKKIFYEVYSNIGDLFLNHLFYDRLILLSFYS